MTLRRPHGVDPVGWLSFITPSNGKGANRLKPKPKYQSKKNRSLKWTGRGLMPVWMREEMKGTKLTKDSFLIK